MNGQFVAKCCGGFFNRLNCLAYARLQLGETPFAVDWPNDPYGSCPLQFDEIFDWYGMQPSEHATVIEQLTIPASCNEPTDKVAAAYEFWFERIIIPIKTIEYDRIGIHYRGMHHHLPHDPYSFGNWVVGMMRMLECKRCFLLADSDREIIFNVLYKEGIDCEICDCPPLQTDLSRGGRLSQQMFISEAIALNGLQIALASIADSTILDYSRIAQHTVISYNNFRSYGPNDYAIRVTKPYTG
jgi:hypothetical protein